MDVIHGRGNLRKEEVYAERVQVEHYAANISHCLSRTSAHMVPVKDQVMFRTPYHSCPPNIAKQQSIEIKFPPMLVDIR